MGRKLIADVVVVIGIVLLSIPVILSLQVRPLVSAIFFFVLPSLYLLIRKPRPLKRILSASFLFGIVFAIPFDFLAIFNGAWSEPNSQLVFKNRILGILAIDHLIWFFFWVFFIFIFYEHFLEHDRIDTISHNYIYGLLPFAAGTVGLIAIFEINKELLRFGYAYLVLGIFALAPSIYLLLRKPNLLSKFIKAGIFFFFLFLTFELTAVKLGQWSFPGQYIGRVNLLGLVFPFEEFFFWILLSSTVMLSYYELWVDDEK